MRPYTVALLSATPAGCRFHPRCPIAWAEPCSTDDPPLVELEPGRFVACHSPGQLEAPVPSDP